MTMSSDLADRLSSLLEQCRDPVFLLSQRRRFLYVNAAWEKLTGVAQAEARQLSCRQREPLRGMSPEDVVRSLCFPPAEVFDGKSIRSRRLCPDAPTGQRWWDIDFLPLCDAEG